MFRTFHLLLMLALSLLIPPKFFSKFLQQRTKRSATALKKLMLVTSAHANFFHSQTNNSCELFHFSPTHYWAVTLSLKDGWFQAYLLAAIYYLSLNLLVLISFSNRSGLFPSWILIFAPIFCLLLKIIRIGRFFKNKNLKRLHYPI